MKFLFFDKILSFITNRRHIFILKSSEHDDTKEILETVNNNIKAEIDIYSNCKDLFFCLNKHKSYYQIGVVNKDDKKNTRNILENLVKSINPKIKILKYTDKNTFKKQCLVR